MPEAVAVASTARVPPRALPAIVGSGDDDASVTSQARNADESGANVVQVTNRLAIVIIGGGTPLLRLTLPRFAIPHERVSRSLLRVCPNNGVGPARTNAPTETPGTQRGQPEALAQNRESRKACRRRPTPTSPYARTTEYASRTTTAIELHPPRSAQRARPRPALEEVMNGFGARVNVTRLRTRARRVAPFRALQSGGTCRRLLPARDGPYCQGAPGGDGVAVYNRSGQRQSLVRGFHGASLEA